MTNITMTLPFTESVRILKKTEIAYEKSLLIRRSSGTIFLERGGSRKFNSLVKSR
jgi:hypothetical protein